MSYVPKNVQDFVARNQQYEKANQHAASLRVGNIHAAWYEKDSQRLNKPGRQHPMNKDSAAARHQAGLREGIAFAKAARQERLKELFVRETLMYEQELQSMGLSLVKHHD